MAKKPKVEKAPEDTKVVGETPKPKSDTRSDKRKADTHNNKVAKAAMPNLDEVMKATKKGLS